MHKPRLMDQARGELRVRHYSYRTEETYVQWIKRFIFFHNKRHPAEMGEAEITAFLNHLAVNKLVSASTQNQALSAILFLYKQVLKQDLAWMDDIVRAKRPHRRPVVLPRGEVQRMLALIHGTNGLVAELLYGSGMRLMECLRLRIKDLDFDYQQITVREGKGNKDRVTVLPASLVPRLQGHLRRVKALHDTDLAQGYGHVYLPFALARKYPHADGEWAWQYLFPSRNRSCDPRSGAVRRHHLSEKNIQRAIRAGAHAAGIFKPFGSHTMRHCFATQLLEDGYDIRTVQELLGHKDVKTTMIYTHVLNRGGRGVKSPLDG